MKKWIIINLAIGVTMTARLICYPLVMVTLGGVKKYVPFRRVAELQQLDIPVYVHSEVLESDYTVRQIAASEIEEIRKLQEEFA